MYKKLFTQLHTYTILNILFYLAILPTDTSILLYKTHYTSLIQFIKIKI